MDTRTRSRWIFSGPLLAGCLLATSPTWAESLGSTLDVYVFPAAGQETSQQNQDEAACYEWAVGEVGRDPFDLMKQQESADQQAAAQQEAASGSTRGSGASSPTSFDSSTTASMSAASTRKRRIT